MPLPSNSSGAFPTRPGRRAPSRRSMLLGLGGAAAALALPQAAYAAPGTAPGSRNGAVTAASTLSRVDRAFLRHGLIHGAWVPNDGSNRWQPGTQQWLDSGFTTPTFYDAPLWNTALMEALPQSTWATAKGPDGFHLDSAPDLSKPVLTGGQLARADDLFAVCFGDEENYSPELQQWLAGLIRNLRTEAPDALAHTNQYAGQWNDSSIRSYMAAADPDLLTFDEYYFSMTSNHAGGSVTKLYNEVERMRRLALPGNDGSYTSPLGFGQYTMGFRSGNVPSLEGGDYIISESEQNVVSFVTWAMGGKWLNLFRWEKSAHATSLLAQQDSAGSFTVQARRYASLNARMSALSPYLTRLRTRSIGLVSGRTAAGLNSPANVPAFSAATDPGTRLSRVYAVIAGGANGGFPGDVLIGTFRPIPGMNASEAAGIYTNPDTPAFMVVNCLAVPNADKTSESGTGGSSADTAQFVVLRFDLSDGSVQPRQLKVLDPQTGSVSIVALSRVQGSVYETRRRIGGGTGELFWWDLPGG